MSNRAWRHRRARHWYSVLGGWAALRRREAATRHSSRPGYGMGVGAKTLIHKGGKS